jgi:putative CRISPR-associated protein (TIGR02620 family)
MEKVIISQHPGLVAWLAERGIVGRVLPRATPAEIAGAEVYGALPWHLAVLAASVTVVELPGLHLEDRGGDLSPEEMDRAGARLQRYTVQAVGPAWGNRDPESGEISSSSCPSVRRPDATRAAVFRREAVRVPEWVAEEIDRILAVDPAQLEACERALQVLGWKGRVSLDDQTRFLLDPYRTDVLSFL